MVRTKPLICHVCISDYFHHVHFITPILSSYPFSSLLFALPASGFRIMPLPRISSRTPLREPSSLLPSNKLSTSMSPLSMRLPGKFRSRTGLFALVGLVCISIYLILAQHTSFSPSLAFRNADTPAADQLAVALETIRNSRVAADAYRHRKMSKGQRPQLHLTTEQELAAVSSFLASLPQNVIPLTVDPSRPIDPQLVLDFDTMSVRAPQEVEAMVEDVWTRNPIFLYSKVRLLLIIRYLRKV